MSSSPVFSPLPRHSIVSLLSSSQNFMEMLSSVSLVVSSQSTTRTKNVLLLSAHMLLLSAIIFIFGLAINHAKCKKVTVGLVLLFLPYHPRYLNPISKCLFAKTTRYDTIPHSISHLVYNVFFPFIIGSPSHLFQRREPKQKFRFTGEIIFRIPFPTQKMYLSWHLILIFTTRNT